MSTSSEWSDNETSLLRDIATGMELEGWDVNPLPDFLRQAADELDRLRAELAAATRRLDIAKAALKEYAAEDWTDTGWEYGEEPIGRFAQQALDEMEKVMGRAGGVKAGTAVLRYELNDLRQHLAAAQAENARLREALVRLEAAADVIAADQSRATDRRCGLLQPITVAEGEELNEAIRRVRAALNEMEKVHVS